MSERYIDHAPDVVRAVIVDPYLDLHISARHGAEPAPARKFEDSRLEEAVGLALALDLEIVGAVSIRLRKLNPATLFGQGKVSEIKALCEEAEHHFVLSMAP